MRLTVHPQEELVVVLVSAQAQTLRLLDESEDNLFGAGSKKPLIRM